MYVCMYVFMLFNSLEMVRFEICMHVCICVCMVYVLQPVPDYQVMYVRIMCVYCMHACKHNIWMPMCMYVCMCVCMYACVQTSSMNFLFFLFFGTLHACMHSVCMVDYCMHACLYVCVYACWHV
jgi:hypothetical protein